MNKLGYALAALLAASIASRADAVQISAFSQTSGNNTVVATNNGANTQTTLTVNDANVDVSQLFGTVTPLNAFLDLSANSINAAQTVLGLAVQNFSGMFCITSAIGCGGINFISGVFTDAAIGKTPGPGLVVNVNNPPDSLTLTSSVIPADDLGAPNTFGLTFSNLTPALHICGQTICGFTASLAGTVSATAATSTPEPASLALLGAGLLGLGFLRMRKE